MVTLPILPKESRMLTVEDRFMIKDLYRKDVSISEIARLTGHDRKTIRAAIRAPLTGDKPKRALRTRIIDPYALYLEKRMEDGVLNAHKLIHGNL